MPDALTMLAATRQAVQATRGSGQMGLAVSAQLAPQARALAALITSDNPITQETAR